MKGTVTTLFAIGILVVSAGAAFAGTAYDPYIQDRIARQQERINHGIATGRLTLGEAMRLQGRLNRIRVQEQRFKSDGRLTGGERAVLHKKLDENSARIYHQKHDREGRF